MRAIMALSALTLVLAAAPTDLRAQPRILELGLGVGHSGTQIYQGQQRTNVGGLAASFRAAWHLTNTLAIEPGLAVTSYDAAGAGILSLGPELGLPYTFGSVYSQQAFYLRPAVGADVLLGNDAAAFDGEVHLNAGMGLGFKLRVSDRAAVRLEYNVTYLFPRSPPRELLRTRTFVGFSFFTR